VKSPLQTRELAAAATHYPLSMVREGVSEVEILKAMSPLLRALNKQAPSSSLLGRPNIFIH
jgi:hypothetical protein